MPEVSGYAAQNAKSALAPFKFNRRDPGRKDTQIDILFGGVCHSDLHTVRNSARTPSIQSFPDTRSSDGSRKQERKSRGSRRASWPRSDA